ncbi:hypothetical protein WL42_07355 [Burkholderia ubonensis]|nr:hypothetical protein WL42_07355 [Burkholderia ubonensis]
MQYWRALADPHASLAETWDEPPDKTSVPTGVRTYSSQDEWQSQRRTTQSDSIETLLLGKDVLGDCFGRLESGMAPDIETELKPVPEVLRLFAPADYHTAAAGQATSLAPPLTRREHHTLTLDSPLVAPTCKDNT